MNPILELIIERYADTPLPYVSWSEREALAERVLAGEALTEAERCFIAAALAAPSKWRRAQESEATAHRRELAISVRVMRRLYGNVESAVRATMARYGVSERQVRKSMAELTADVWDSDLVDGLMDSVAQQSPP